MIDINKKQRYLGCFAVCTLLLMHVEMLCYSTLVLVMSATDDGFPQMLASKKERKKK